MGEKGIVKTLWGQMKVPLSGNPFFFILPHFGLTAIPAA
jgi:hypothetical protein